MTAHLSQAPSFVAHQMSLFPWAAQSCALLDALRSEPSISLTQNKGPENGDRTDRRREKGKKREKEGKGDSDKKRGRGPYVLALE